MAKVKVPFQLGDLLYYDYGVSIYGDKLMTRTQIVQQQDGVQITFSTPVSVVFGPATFNLPGNNPVEIWPNGDGTARILQLADGCTGDAKQFAHLFERGTQRRARQRRARLGPENGVRGAGGPKRLELDAATSSQVESNKENIQNPVAYFSPLIDEDGAYKQRHVDL